MANSNLCRVWAASAYFEDGWGDPENENFECYSVAENKPLSKIFVSHECRTCQRGLWNDSGLYLMQNLIYGVNNKRLKQRTSKVIHT